MIRLCMIVKDERLIVRRAIASVRSAIGAWTIVDTGSTDSTAAVVAKTLSDLPGTLHHRPWKNFGANRNECLELAEADAAPGDYLLMLDADDRLEGAPPDPLVEPCYWLRTVRGESLGWRPHLWRAGEKLRYQGATHEALGSRTASYWPHWRYLEGRDGARSLRGEKLRDDARLLEQAIAEHPDDARALHYLAQTYRELALGMFERRIALGGWPEERGQAALHSARLAAELGRPRAAVVDAYMLAAEAAPTRAEPLFELARYLRLEHRMHAAAYPYAAAAAAMPLPEGESLNVEARVYAWAARDEQAVCAYWTERYVECAALCKILLRTAPESELARIATNRDRALERIPHALMRRELAGAARTES